MSTTARYFRLYVTANDGDASYVSLSELQLKLGTTILSAPAKDHYFTQQSGNGQVGGITNAFDGNLTSVTGSAIAWPYTIQMDMGGAITVDTLSITSQAAAQTRSPRDFKLQALSDDGATWIDILTVTGSSAWGSQETRSWAITGTASTLLTVNFPGRSKNVLYEANKLSAQANYGGTYTLSGTVSVNGIPAHRPVRLYEASTGLLITSQWSAADGTYSFVGLHNRYLYQVVATDYPAYTYQDKSLLQTAGTWTGLNINLDNVQSNLVVSQSVLTSVPADKYKDLSIPHSYSMKANADYGGAGNIMGVVTLSGTPVARRVRLYEQKTGLQIASLITGSNGEFLFSNLNAGRPYAVMASDFPNYAYSDAIASNLSTVATNPVVIYSGQIDLPLRKADRAQYVAYYGGTGKVSGFVEINTVHVKRKVRLYEQASGILVREIWANADGSYSFTGLNKGYKYTVTATDYPNYNYNDVIACNITPE